MAGSYKSINFQIRPAKNIERKMLAEAFRRLMVFGPLSSYRYVGLGSTFFSDFSLFHKVLGTSRMISIEVTEDQKGRFRFNRPYLCVQVKFGHSNDVLPTLPWKEKTILWLDYDGLLNERVFTDIRLFCTRAVPGSMIIITVNARPARYDPERNDPNRVDLLRRHVGPDRVPPDIQHADLSDWGTATVYHRIINNEILERIADRNGALVGGQKLLYRQLFNFHYSDSSMMLTVGGLVYRRADQTLVDSSGLERSRLDFIRTGVQPFLIDPPNLTLRELHHLDGQFPLSIKSRRTRTIPATERDKYSRLYRYFPKFAEAEV